MPTWRTAYRVQQYMSDKGKLAILSMIALTKGIQVRVQHGGGFGAY